MKIDDWMMSKEQDTTSHIPETGVLIKNSHGLYRIYGPFATPGDAGDWASKELINTRIAFKLVPVISKWEASQQENK